MIYLIIVLLLISVLALILSIHSIILFNRFNKSITDWARNLDNSTHDAIMRQSRIILRDLDQRITNINNNEKVKSDE